MSSENPNTREVLILTDETGNMYAIPRDVLVNHILTGEQKAAVEKELSSEDVAGFSMAGRDASTSSAANVQSAGAAANNYAGATSAAADANANTFAAANSAYAANSSAASASTGMLSGAFFNLNVNLFGTSSDRYM